MFDKDKLKSIERIFDTTDIVLESNLLIVENQRYPIVNDVIILLEPDKYTDFVKSKLRLKTSYNSKSESEPFKEDIQHTFGEEWKLYDHILDDHKQEILQYFDIVDLEALRSSTVCDLGCGNGRWSYFLKDSCKEIILVDFSDAIFVARKNLESANNCLFFMCDLKTLPFSDNFVDLLFCLGVLHHLPTSCLDEVRNLKRLAQIILICLYYSLDNRPIYFRIILKLVTFVRLFISRIRSLVFRKCFSLFGTFFIYVPLIYLAMLLKPLKISIYIPHYNANHDKSIKRIQQDAYDRFFTSIEQRVSRKEILALNDTFLG